MGIIEWPRAVDCGIGGGFREVDLAQLVRSLAKLLLGILDVRGM